METVMKRLRDAKRPLILAGHGVRVSGLTKQFREASKQWNIPIVTTQLARDLILYEDDLYIGTPGVKGDRAGGLAIQNADVILIIGSSLHATTTGYEMNLFAPQAYKILVDLDILNFEKNKGLAQYRCHASIDILIQYFWVFSLRLDNPGWHSQCLEWKQKFDLRKEHNRTRIDHKINYYDVIDAIHDLSDPNATIIADAGSAFYITGQAYRAKGNQRVILPGGLAQMGYTTSAMIGACFADPDHMVIGLTGDGSIQTNIHDLAVIAHHKLNAKILLLNNQGYSCIRNTQDHYFKGHYSGVDYETGVSFPDFRTLSDAYRIPYRICSHVVGLSRVIEEVLTSCKGPVLCEIMTKTNQEIEPLVRSEVMPDGSMKSNGLDKMYPYLT